MMMCLCAWSAAHSGFSAGFANTQALLPLQPPCGIGKPCTESCGCPTACDSGMCKVVDKDLLQGVRGC